MNDLVENLKKLRASKKFTQKEMAKFLGINPRTYQNYESMKSNLSISKLNLIANKFCITISDLFSPNYLVGDPYKNLRPQLIILLYIENQLSKKQKEQELIENQIQNENNPENLRKLFEELKSINENIGWLKKSIADCKTKISTMSENQVIENNSYYNEFVILKKMYEQFNDETHIELIKEGSCDYDDEWEQEM